VWRMDVGWGVCCVKQALERKGALCQYSGATALVVLVSAPLSLQQTACPCSVFAATRSPHRLFISNIAHHDLLFLHMRHPTADDGPTLTRSDGIVTPSVLPCQVAGDRLVLANTGDSRALLGSASGAEVRALTAPHSLARHDEVGFRWLRDGQDFWMVVVGFQG
jgi:serine/threonine protein phosphatase PrpC